MSLNVLYARCAGLDVHKAIIVACLLLTASFIPPKAIRDLRDLVRARKTLVRQRAQAITRVQKVLETANIKLSSVATDVLGKSGRDMIEALIAGISDAEAMAELARGRLRKKL